MLVHAFHLLIDKDKVYDVVFVCACVYVKTKESEISSKSDVGMSTGMFMILGGCAYECGMVCVFVCAQAYVHMCKEK